MFLGEHSLGYLKSVLDLLEGLTLAKLSLTIAVFDFPTKLLTGFLVFLPHPSDGLH